MASKWVDKASAVVANTVYSDGKLVARDVAVTLPEVNHVMAELNAGGPTEIPITGWIEAMELSITLKGIDPLSIARLARQQRQNIEIRFVEDMMLVDGFKRNAGCKAFFTAIPKGIPGLEIELGEVPENEMLFSVIRYQLYVDNQDVLCVDKFNNIYRVGGIDYAESIESML